MGIWAALITGGAVPAVAATAAADVVTTTTGIRLMGELKKLDKDVLTLETAYSDSDFKIEWDKVASIESDRQFLVETFAGHRVSGTLKADPTQKATVVVGNERFPLADISIIEPYERSFWSRFDAGFDVGYSMTQANSAKNLTLGGNLSYRDRKSLDSVFVSAFKNSQSNAPDTNRWELGNDYRYRYFRIGLFENYDSKPPAGLQKNDYGWSNSFGL